MALDIKDPATDASARALAARPTCSGSSIGDTSALVANP